MPRLFKTGAAWSRSRALSSWSALPSAIASTTPSDPRSRSRRHPAPKAEASLSWSGRRRGLPGRRRARRPQETDPSARPARPRSTGIAKPAVVLPIPEPGPRPRSQGRVQTRRCRRPLRGVSRGSRPPPPTRCRPEGRRRPSRPRRCPLAPSRRRRCRFPTLPVEHPDCRLVACCRRRRRPPTRRRSPTPAERFRLRRRCLRPRRSPGPRRLHCRRYRARRPPRSCRTLRSCPNPQPPRPFCRYEVAPVRPAGRGRKQNRTGFLRSAHRQADASSRP